MMAERAKTLEARVQGFNAEVGLSKPRGTAVGVK